MSKWKITDREEERGEKVKLRWEMIIMLLLDKQKEREGVLGVHWTSWEGRHKHKLQLLAGPGGYENTNLWNTKYKEKQTWDMKTQIHKTGDMKIQIYTKYNIQRKAIGGYEDTHTELEVNCGLSNLILSWPLQSCWSGAEVWWRLGRAAKAGSA